MTPGKMQVFCYASFEVINQGENQANFLQCLLFRAGFLYLCDWNGRLFSISLDTNYTRLYLSIGKRAPKKCVFSQNKH